MSFGPPTASGYSAFFDHTLARTGNGAETNYNAMSRYGRAGTEMALARLLAKGGFRGIRRVMLALTGAAAGGAAGETYTRVGTVGQGVTDIGPGGLRVMETFTANSGNTTSAQETYIETHILNARFAQNPTSYPTDLSGNGGGGKVGI